jgi:hypothetical protein
MRLGPGALLPPLALSLSPLSLESQSKALTAATQPRRGLHMLHVCCMHIVHCLLSLLRVRCCSMLCYAPGQLARFDMNLAYVWSS